MSRKRTATSVINGKSRNVVQHAKLPPPKRPDGRAFNKLVKALDNFFKVQVLYDDDAWTHAYDHARALKELENAAAPFRRYEEHK
jgi:hypothetical protein